MLINATTRNISILSINNVDFSPYNKFFYSAEDLIVVNQVIPTTSFVCEVEIYELSKGLIDGIPTKEVSYGAITNLPAPQEGVFYILDNLVASVAKSRGRTDILTASHPVYDASEPCGGPFILGYLVLER